MGHPIIGVSGQKRQIRSLRIPGHARVHNAAGGQLGSIRAGLDPDQLGLLWPGDHRPARLGQHIYFAAHAEFREIDSRFYREAGVRQNQALVVGFEIVQIGSIAVGLHGYAVPRPVGEVLCEAGVANHTAGRIIGLPSRQRPACSERLLHSLDGRIPCLRNHGEDLPFAVAGSRPTTPVQVMS
jgi:hypothetical protein